jgi:N-methylhydantoinase A
VPARPGITNALGCIVADLRHDFVRTLNVPLPAADMGEVHAVFAEQRAEGLATVAREGVTVEETRALHFADMQFQGQTHLLTVAVDDPEIAREDLHAAFAKAYWQRFMVELPEIRPVLVNLHTAVIGKRPAIALEALLPPEARANRVEDALLGERRVWFAPGGWQATPVYARDKLPFGAEVAGPAIVQQLDTTLVLEPQDALRVDATGNLIVTVGREGALA